MYLRQELSAVEQVVREETPSHVMPTIESSIHALKESGLERRAIQPGETIRDFELPDATGAIVKTLELRTLGPLLIVFYRGAWCPFRNLTLQAFQERYSEIASRGVSLVAISPQTPDHSLSLQEKHYLRFPVLSDRGNKVAQQFGIVFELDRDLKVVQEQIGVDIPSFNGDHSFQLPVPATFLASKDGKVLGSFVVVDYMKRLEPRRQLLGSTRSGD
jgi:peroxiredoxin